MSCYEAESYSAQWAKTQKMLENFIFLQTCTLGQKSKIYLKMLVYSIFNNWKFLNIFCRFGPMCSVKFCRHVCGTLPDKKSINSTLAQVTKVKIFGRSGLPQVVVVDLHTYILTEVAKYILAKLS